MRTLKTHPLPVGTPVAIDIAEGMSRATGVITAAEYDDGWLYRVDLAEGDDCQVHRNAAGELWVCDFEVMPSDAPVASPAG